MCVAETDVISQRTSVPSVLKGEKDMQSSTLGWVMMCARVCVYICMCDCFGEMRFYCFINLLLEAGWRTTSVAIHVRLHRYHPIHECSNPLCTTDKSQNGVINLYLMVVTLTRSLFMFYMFSCQWENVQIKLKLSPKLMHFI